MVASNTTRLLITRTTRLRAALRQFDPYTAGSLLLIALIVVGGLIRQAWATPGQTAPAPAAIVVATPRPPAPAPPGGGGDHVVARPISRAPIAVRAAPTVPPALPTAEPPAPPPAPIQAAAPVEPAEQQFQVDSAPPAPTAITGWTADPHIDQTEGGSISTFDPPADAPRLCTGFGDWRDYDANYASSPACHQPAPEAP